MPTSAVEACRAAQSPFLLSCECARHMFARRVLDTDVMCSLQLPYYASTYKTGSAASMRGLGHWAALREAQRRVRFTS